MKLPEREGMAEGRTQRITATDIRGGRIRVPHDSKGMFPDARVYVRVSLRGRDLDARWDPRFGPDRERSGVLGIGRRILRDLIQTNEMLTIARDADGPLKLY